MAERSQRYRVQKHEAGREPRTVDDDVVEEEPLEIRVAGRGIGVTMRTPGHDDELSLGFLLGEGVIAKSSDVARVRRCDKSAGDVLDVLVAERVAIDFAALTRHVFASSSCGLCGTATIDAVRKRFAGVPEGPIVKESVIHSMAPTLRAAQPTFDRTGGLHAAGVFDLNGQLLVAREDVGRHNAVDKVLGHMLAGGCVPLRTHMLMVSGRASFEIVQKALAAAVPIVAAVSAPSSLAIDLAVESNITLIGFVREGRFNVYSHSERIISG